MPMSRKQARRPRRMPRWMVVGLITVLAAAALALTYVAVTVNGSGDHPGLPVKAGVPASEDAVVLVPSPHPDAQPKATQDPAEGTLPQRILAMVGGTAVRGSTGTCENPGTVEISLDAGQSWRESVTTAEAGATRILRLLPTDPSLVQIVALDRNCEPQVYRTTDVGSTWEGPLPVGGTWYFDPSNPEWVGAPDGIQPLICEGAELAATGDRAAVRCLDGSVVTTADRGITWSYAAGVGDVVAINYSSDAYVVAQAGDPTCEGIRFTSLGQAMRTVQDGCFETDPNAEEVEFQGIAIAQSGNSTLLWLKNDLVSSTDGGTTWL